MIEWLKVWRWRLRVWYVFISNAHHGWLNSVRHAHPDDNYCCDGRECGCYGMSMGDVYSNEVPND